MVDAMFGVIFGQTFGIDVTDRIDTRPAANNA